MREITFDAIPPGSYHCDINLHAGRGLTLRGEAEGNDAYTAFGKAAEHVGKRLRRYRRRVSDHARDEAQRTRPDSARQIILAAEAEDHEEPETTNHVAPAVIAETTTVIAHLSVGEAVMRMELSDHPVLMFRDMNSGVLNVVYRRADGNIGWIDPGNERSVGPIDGWSFVRLMARRGRCIALEPSAAIRNPLVDARPSFRERPGVEPDRRSPLLSRAQRQQHG